MFVFCKKLDPSEIAVVNIDPKIMKPYTILKILNIFDTTYTAGISSFVMSISTFVNNKNIITDNIIVISVAIIDIWAICFLSFK